MRYFILFIMMSLLTRVSAYPLVNADNNTLNVNITKENIIQSGTDTLNSTMQEANQIKEKIPNEIKVKAPGFTVIDNLMMLFGIIFIIRKKVV